MEGLLEVTRVAQEGKKPAQGHPASSWSRQDSRELPSGPVVKTQHFHWELRSHKYGQKKKRQKSMSFTFLAKALFVILCLP